PNTRNVSQKIVGLVNLISPRSQTSRAHSKESSFPPHFSCHHRPCRIFARPRCHKYPDVGSRFAVELSHNARHTSHETHQVRQLANSHRSSLRSLSIEKNTM